MNKTTYFHKFDSVSFYATVFITDMLSIQYYTLPWGYEKKRTKTCFSESQTFRNYKHAVQHNRLYRYQ